VADVLHISLQMALGIALPIWIIRRDMKRLSEAVVSRCWNDASIWSAVVAFGPLSLVVHFARSRRSVLGFALGIAWAIVSVLALAALGWAFEPFADG
jgi:hypothetical protein